MLKKQSRLAAAALALAVPAALATTVSAAAASAQGPSLAPVMQANVLAPLGVRVRSGAIPVRVADPAAYAAHKAAANAAAKRLATRAAAPAKAPLAPSLVRNWAGQQDPTTAPSDSTGAIGTQRYVELVNSKVGIYSRTSNTPTASGTLLKLTGCAVSGCPDFVGDPQVIWDPAQNRFFYAALDLVSSTQNFLNFGFSTSATPTLSSGSWCRYHFKFGSNIPDYPKLGDTKDFMLIGFNEFNSSLNFTGSRITWVTTPPSGSSCPAASTFKRGTSGTLHNADASAAFTPVPANQTDSSSTGYAVGIPASMPAAFLTVFKITKSSTGTAVITTTGTSVTVPSYNVPASAPQPGTAFTLDTLDGRLTQAVSAVDPVHGSATALWTQHTILGGAGAVVRWYEIKPATSSLLQHGTISSSTLFTFNGAVSPDRRVNSSSTTKMFGGDMVISADQSSSAALPTVVVASKIGTNPLSALTLAATSAAADTGFDCGTSGAPNVCRWGDYAGASPDPASPTGTGITTGQVWGSSMMGAAGGNPSTAGWTTLNFAVKA